MSAPSPPPSNLIEDAYAKIDITPEVLAAGNEDPDTNLPSQMALAIPSS